MTHLLLKIWALRSLYPAEQARLRILSDMLLAGTFLEDFWSLPFSLLGPLSEKLLEGGSLEAWNFSPFSMVLHLSRPRSINSLSNVTFSWKHKKIHSEGNYNTKESIRPWTFISSASQLFFLSNRNPDIFHCVEYGTWTFNSSQAPEYSDLFIK